ncbi:MAG: hypothetical protein HYZ74_00510 [Elusimicrobia bacterium]|nr:hypothetical protein [Elusimicrobiota bacterium]
MLYGGVYAKDLQHGLYPFGIDWIGTLGYGFDGGMTAVLALHVRDAVPRLKTLNQDGSAPARCAILLIILAGAACVYGVNTVFKFYRAQRSLGPTWLLGDILFASAAWALAARAKASAEREEPAASRELWIWGVAGFVVWLPVARVIARTCAATGLPDALLYFFVGAWTAAAGWAFWRLWLTRGRVDPAPVSRSRFALAAALGRALGAAAVALSVGWDARSGGVFALLIDLPTHALFAWAFLTSRLEV